MHGHQPFTIRGARLFDGTQTLNDTCLRVVDGRIASIGAPTIAAAGDALIDAGGGTLLPGLIDAHVHLLPGATQLAATFGVTTLVDQFSKPEVIDPERRSVAAAEAGQGPPRADLRTSSIGATAPGGHPTIAYAPIPYVNGPGEAEMFVEARVAEGADHLKVIYDDGSGAWLDIPALEVATIEALVTAAHRRDLPVVAHASTARGALTVARCGIDVLAHAPFDRMSEDEVRDVARTGVALIATLAILDGFPGPDGVMPLLAQPALAARLSVRWRRVLEAQARRWMPPQVPDGTVARANTIALFESGVRVLAGTDAPNPGLLPGPSLHRELQHLVHAGLRPVQALVAATSTAAQVFGLTDRGRLAPGSRADLVLVGGDPTVDITATQQLRRVWVLGREVLPELYPSSPTEREGIAWLRESNAKIVTAIQESWPGIPAPQDVHREDGELLGRLVPTSGGWQPVTTFGAPLGDVAGHDEALATVRALGLSSLAEPWWVREVGQETWQEARLLEVRPDRVRLRWADPMADQPPAGQWFDLDDLDLARILPVKSEGG